jgi:hypothetical protein
MTKYAQLLNESKKVLDKLDKATSRKAINEYMAELDRLNDLIIAEYNTISAQHTDTIKRLTLR